MLSSTWFVLTGCRLRYIEKVIKEVVESRLTPSFLNWLEAILQIAAGPKVRRILETVPALLKGKVQDHQLTKQVTLQRS